MVEASPALRREILEGIVKVIKSDNEETHKTGKFVNWEAREGKLNRHFDEEKIAAELLFGSDNRFM